MTANTSLPSIVMVDWIDSTTECGQAWNDKKTTVKELEDAEYPRSLMCHTVGFLVHENDHAITLALSTCEVEIGPYTMIPKLAVMRRETVRTATGVPCDNIPRIYKESE